MVLVAAETWGCPPWEIAGGNKLTWLYRWQALAEARAISEKAKSGR